MKYRILFYILLLTSYIQVYPQTLDRSTNNIGISVSYTHANLLDNVISANEYTGSMLSYGLEYKDIDKSKLTSLEFFYNKANELKFLNTSASSVIFSTIYKHLILISNTEIIKNPTIFYIGPAVEMFYHNRRQKVASRSAVNSNAHFLSCNLVAFGTSDLNKNLNISAEISASLFSYNIRPVSTILNDNKMSPSALLPFYESTNIKTLFTAEYDITSLISLEIGYRFSYSNILNWDHFRLSQDNLFISTGVSF